MAADVGPRRERAAVGSRREASRILPPMSSPSAPPRSPLMRRWVTPGTLALLGGLALLAVYPFLSHVAAERPTVRSWSMLQPSIATWTVLAAILGAVSPRAGLVVLIGIGAYADPPLVRQLFVGTFNVSDVVRAKIVIAVALLLGVMLNALVARTRRADGHPPRPGAARSPGEAGPVMSGLTDLAWRLAHPAVVLLLAAALVIATGISLFAVSVGPDERFARDSIGVWLGGLVVPFAALLVAMWLAVRGDRTAVVAVVIAASIAGLVGLIDHLSRGAFDGTPFAWTIEQGVISVRRLSGVPGLPNAAATMMLGPTILLASAAGGTRDRRAAVLAGLGAAAAFVVLYLTFSRSALIALLVAGVIVAWRRHRRAGLAALAVGLLAAVVLLPSALGSRGDADVDPGGTAILAKGDPGRVRAWGAALRMFADAPVTGHGFQTYKLLHAQYGEPELTAPHNEWLRFFAEEGALAGLAGLGCIALGALALGRDRRWLGAGMLGVFVAYVLVAGFNNPFTYGQVGLMVTPVIGTGLGLAWTARMRGRPPPT